MPRYLFNVISGDNRRLDEIGQDLAGDQAAFDYAVRSLQQLLRMPSGQQINAGAYSIEVEGADGHILFTVPLDLPIVQRSDY